MWYARLFILYLTSLADEVSLFVALLRFRRDRGPVRGQDDAFLVVGVGAEDVPRVVRFVLLGTVANPEGGLSCGWVLGALVLGQNELMEKQVLRRREII